MLSSVTSHTSYAQPSAAAPAIRRSARMRAPYVLAALCSRDGSVASAGSFGSAYAQLASRLSAHWPLGGAGSSSRLRFASDSKCPSSLSNRSCAHAAGCSTLSVGARRGA
eukprot:4462125-Prymnesium_polylepis.2